jgi:hypothetical protein
MTEFDRITDFVQYCTRKWTKYVKRMRWWGGCEDVSPEAVVVVVVVGGGGGGGGSGGGGGVVIVVVVVW